jgi:hypothetical protein
MQRLRAKNSFAFCLVALLTAATWGAPISVISQTQPSEPAPSHSAIDDLSTTPKEDSFLGKATAAEMPDSDSHRDRPVRSTIEHDAQMLVAPTDSTPSDANRLSATPAESAPVRNQFVVGQADAPEPHFLGLVAAASLLLLRRQRRNVDA